MPPGVLAFVFLAVMGSALACFVRAFALRHATPRHVRWAVAGMVIDVLGTIAVVLSARLLGWHVPANDETVALVHRSVAYLATGLMAAQAWTGARRIPVHHVLGPLFLAVYAITYVLAAVAYAPLR